MWFKNKFVAIMPNRICVSEDGLNWRTIKELSCSGNFILKSYDGLSWDFVDSNIKSMPDLDRCNSFIWNGKEFIAVGTGGFVISTKDLITWCNEQTNTTNNLKDIISNENTTIAVGYGSTIITAKDENNSSDNVKEFKEATFNDRNKAFSIKFTRDANFEECEKYICVSKDPSGNEPLKDVKLTLGSSGNIINISAPPQGYEDGTYYIIIKPGLSEKGNDTKKIKKTIRMKFSIKNT